jgi:pimeloyl-ACP methyl ester carboxylesterase
VLIVGYSFGGGIALHLAPRLDSLRRLVLLSPAGKPVGFRRLGLLRRIVGEGIRGWRCARKAGRPEIFARIARDFLLNGLKRPLRQRAVFALTLRCLNGGADFSAVTTRAHIASVDGDRFFVPRSGEALAREMPHAAWTLKRGTHLWPLIDHPEVERFLLGVGG